MLVCSPEGEPHSSPEEPVISTGPTVTGHIEGKAEKKKYNWKHGSKSPVRCSFWLTTRSLELQVTMNQEPLTWFINLLFLKKKVILGAQHSSLPNSCNSNSYRYRTVFSYMVCFIMFLF